MTYVFLAASWQRVFLAERVLRMNVFLLALNFTLSTRKKTHEYVTVCLKYLSVVASLPGSSGYETATKCLMTN